ncbi:MAG: hypothetical protein JXR97_06865 [Planctomycetes bacterium]|nr:hypothetical protein [Planctomycetota bacterium]
MAKVKIEGILECYPQMTKDNAESGMFYVTISESESNIPDTVLPVVNVAHSSNPKFAKERSSHRCKAAGHAVFFTDQTVMNNCVPGDSVELVADLHAVSRPYWSDKDQAVKYRKIPDRILVLDGKIKKAKATA